MSLEDTVLEEQDIEVGSYRFFGVPFSVGFDSPASARTYRRTYGHLRNNPANGEIEEAVTFKIYSGSPGNETKRIVVGSAGIDHLVNVFRRGSNRHRFRIEESESGGLYRVADAFLGFKQVMLVGERTCYFLDPERSQAYAESVIFHTVLSHVANHVVLHAGVVSLNGRAVILCGEANKGKTTLTLALVREGFKFLSDEVAFIDRKTGMVQPFPRALGLRENTLSMFSEVSRMKNREATQSLSGDEKWLIDIDDIFPGRRGDSAAVSRILFLEGFSEETVLTPMSSADALLQCTKFAHTADDSPIQSMLAVADVVQQAKCFHLHSGTIEDTVRAVSESVKE